MVAPILAGDARGAFARSRADEASSRGTPPSRGIDFHAGVDG